jgi:hypothetical protein
MNPNYDNTENFRVKRKRKEEIAKSFREETFSISKSDSVIIKKVEDAVLECLNYGWEIDSMLEDEKISPYEFDQISSHLEKLGDVTRNLEKNDEDNFRVMNNVLSIYDCLKGIISEIQYTEDVRPGLGNTPIPTNKKGYVVEEESYLSNLEDLLELIKTRKIDSEDQLSKLEREIIKAIKVIGLIDEEITMNVLYIKPTFYMKEIMVSVEVLRATIEPIYTLIKGYYFREEIKSAKIGISLMSEDKSLNVGDAIKIRGLFSRPKGVDSLEKLSRTLKTIENDDSE